MIYADSSALLKLVRTEGESAALTAWLADRPDDPVVMSEVGRIEVLRVARRFGDAALAEARAVLGDVDLVRLGRGVQDLACDVGDAALRTLDALHLASALAVEEAVRVFVCYDARLARAARAAGFEVAAPGGR